MKNGRQISQRAIIIALILFVHGCASVTSVCQHQDFDKLASNIHLIVIAPPVVTIEEITFTGENTHMVEKEEAIKAELRQLATQELNSRGLTVVDFDFKAALQDDPDFAFEVNQVLEAFKQARAELYDGRRVSEEDKAKFNASLGPVINSISTRSGADAVLLLHYYGFEKSAGMVAKDFAAGVLSALLTGVVASSPTSGSQVEVALIDGASGAVLWVNTRGVPALSTAMTQPTMREMPLAINTTTGTTTNTTTTTTKTTDAEVNVVPAKVTTTSEDSNNF